MGNFFSCCEQDKFQSNKYSCYMSDFEKRIYPLIDHIKVQKYQRSILKKRFAKLVINYEELSAAIVWRYNLCRLMISIGSMILPTLQTIQDSENVKDYKDYIYWCAIGTSLSVMISNNLISMFELDKKYIMYSVTAEKLKSLGWKFFELSDMFAGKTHSENWILFWNEIEHIKKLQILAEYSSHDDKANNSGGDLDDEKFNGRNIEYSSDDYDSDDHSKKKKHHKIDIDLDNIESNIKDKVENNIKDKVETTLHNIDKDEIKKVI